MGAQFTIPLITTIPGQLIASALWNNEFNNLNTNFIPAGMDSYSDTDPQMQIQTAPFPGSVTSHASNLGWEIERIRYQIAQILGTTYWYNAPSSNIAAIVKDIVPIGGSILFPSATPPNSNWLLKNGQAIGRVAYAALFALIGTTFGAGDGSTTFNIPNATDKMPIGAGNLYALAATGGAVSNTPIITANLTDPGHTHTQNAHQHATTMATAGGGATLIMDDTNPYGTTVVNHNYQSNGTGAFPNTPFNYANTSSVIPTENSNTTGITAAPTSTAVPTLPPYLAEYWMIRAL